MSKAESKTDQKPEKQRGIACPKCGCGHFRVIYTRGRPGYLMRRRECRHCGRRVTTREKSSE